MLRRRPSRGLALVEALVAVLIFSLGLLGLVGLQASMTRAQGSAGLRADAAYLASDLLGQMWSDQANLARYDSGGCTQHARCADWARKLADLLPAGEAQVQVRNSGEVAITITWSTPEGTHRHALATAIR